MPDMKERWSKFSAGTAQVLVCDLQEQIVARSKTNPPGSLSQAGGVLCRIAELFELPLTLSVVPENNEKPVLIEPLRRFASGENQFLRATASPFLDAKTKTHLASVGRNTLILAGFATEVVVLHAALDALCEGYDVLVAVDACGGMSDRTESATFNQIRDSGGIITSVVSLATALSPDFTAPIGQKMFQIVQTLRLA